MVFITDSLKNVPIQSENYATGYTLSILFYDKIILEVREMVEVATLEDERIRNEIQYIGLRIAYFRKMRNLTQAKLAELVSINKNYLSHIESGSSSKVISLPLLIKISKALDVKLSILVDMEEIDSPKDELRREFNEMRAMFDEIKKFNADLDKIISDIEKFNPNF